MNEWVVGIVSGVLSGAVVGGLFYALAERDLRKKREEIQRASEEALAHLQEALAALRRSGEKDVRVGANRGREEKRTRGPSGPAVAAPSEVQAREAHTSTERADVPRRFSGTIKKYFARKGFGFISRPDGPDVFFHRSEAAEVESLSRGDRVEFDVEETEPGKLRAKNVVRVKEVG